MRQLSLVVFLAVASSVLGVSSHTQPAQAFGDLLGRGGPCYKPHAPEVRKRTVRKHVVKRPGIYDIKRRPGLYGYRKVRVRTSRGKVVWRYKRVLLKPYENVAKYHEPRERWVRKRQRIIATAPPRPRGAWPDRC